MSLEKSSQSPVRSGQTTETDPRTQMAALCFRVLRDNPQVLLITSRDTGRWVIPKGWPVDGKAPADSAAQEAWEEAGVVGKVYDTVVGLYSYDKVLEPGSTLPCMVAVFPLRVKRLAADFPEKGERRLKWFSPRKASARVQEPELAHILENFDPRPFR